MSAKAIRAVYQFRVNLRDIEPPIWREVQVWEDAKLPRLHQILQLVFNWEDCHLHEFVLGRRVYAEPDPEDEWYGRKVIDERDIPVSLLANRVGDEFGYHYDFGDNWQHRVLLEAVLLPDVEAFYPRCIAGSRNAPPEDVGGVGGYGGYLEALADPDHEEHQNMLAWRGPFDPEAFSLDQINASLKRKYYRRPKKSIGASKIENKPVLPVRKSPEVDVIKFMLAALRGEPTPEVPQIRIVPGTTLPLELTDRERELILKHSFAPDELTRPLRIVPPAGKPAVVRYTLDDLDNLAGFVASESNHANDRKLHKEWEKIFVKIAAILESHTDEEGSAAR